MDLRAIRMAIIEQTFPRERLPDVPAKVRQELARCQALASLPRGARVAITAGSRGIANLPLILKETGSYLKEQGLAPFLVPAMGSHGGATAHGQKQILHSLGVNETSTGMPIHSSMETVLLGYTAAGMPVYLDRLAAEADGIIIINRIKAHTAFQGPVESGLSKMIAVGLGKEQGAVAIHRQGPGEMAASIMAAAALALEKAPILFGLAILENGYDETADLVGLAPSQWFAEEGALLQRAKALAPKLPLDELDILLVGEMGKNYSGTGMDTGVIGRWRIAGVPEPEKPRIKRLGVLDLAPGSHGNANGIGLADFVTRRLVAKMDPGATYTNALATTFFQRVMIPMTLETDEELVKIMLRTLGEQLDPDRLKLVFIPNTLQLHRLAVSQGALAALRDNPRIRVVAEGLPLAFAGDGSLILWPQWQDR